MSICVFAPVRGNIKTHTQKLVYRMNRLGLGWAISVMRFSPGLCQQFDPILRCFTCTHLVSKLNVGYCTMAPVIAHSSVGNLLILLFLLIILITESLNLYILGLASCFGT